MESTDAPQPPEELGAVVLALSINPSARG